MNQEIEYDYPANLKFLFPLAVIAGAVLPTVMLFPLAVVLYPEVTLVALVSGCIFLCVNFGYCATQPVAEPQPLSRNELRHLLGRTSCTFYTIILLLAGLIFHTAMAPSGNRVLEFGLELTKSLAALIILLPMWLLANRMSKEPIKAGHVMSFFWCGALFSAGIAGFPNTGLLLLWEKLDPECNAETPLGPKWPFESPDSSCLFKATVEWILTPGVVEEGLKFVVLTRLVTSVEEAVKSRALTRFPRMSGASGMPCCGWFLKIAASPVVVVLSGMSVGAGFSYMENIDYLAKIAPTVFATRNILTAEVRLFAAILHIAMTGTCAFFLAVSMFSPGGKRWYMKYVGFVLMMFGHGIYDAICTFQHQFGTTSCFVRTRCFDKDGEDTCAFYQTGELGLCACPKGTHAARGKCAFNGRTPDAQLFMNATHAFDSHKDDAPTRAVLKDAGEEHFIPAVLAKDAEVKTIGLPQPLRNLITLPLSAARLLGKGDLEEKYECPVGAPQLYECGPQIVKWWPGSWTSYVWGGGILAFFAALCCVGLPMLQNSAESAAPAAPPPRSEEDGISMSETPLSPVVVVG